MTRKICECGARARVNYPFGKKSKGRYTLTKKHDRKCSYKGQLRGKRKQKKRRT